ncbi:MAG: right-handed parallel beta-helix repeat-containing protein [Thermoguttaceae bacterium]|nr:right-handed parallel beta-helix repeat-containing protein [Thermoguttaceae bacterium]
MSRYSFDRRFSNSVRSSKSFRRASKAPKTRALRLESLEDRSLLSVSAAEFDAIRQAYSKLDLPESPDAINVVDLQADELSYAAINKAIQDAAATPEDDLIVLRTTNANYQLDLGAASVANTVDCEPNDSLSTAYDLGEISGVLSLGSDLSSGSDKDYFKFSIGETGTSDHYVKLTYEHGSGRDFDLKLYSSQGSQLAYSMGVTGVETISLEGRQAGVYYAYVYNYSGGSGAYALEISAPETTPQLDSPSLALQVEDTNVSVSIGAVENATSYVLQYDLEPSFTTCEEAIFNVSGVYSFENFTPFTAYYFRVKATADQWRDSSWATADVLIGEPDALEPNDGIGSAYDLGTLTETYSNSALNLLDASDVDWFKFTTVANGGENDWIQLSADYSVGFFALYFRVLDANVDEVGSGLVYNESGSISLNNLPKGTYYLGVYNMYSEGRGGEYSLEISPPAPLGENELDRPIVAIDSVGGSSITLNVAHVANATGYLLQCATDSGFANCVELSSLESGALLVDNLERATQYYLRVKAIADGFADSAWASISTWTTADPDRYESNDSMETAYNLGALTGVSTLAPNLLYETDEDFFKFTILDEGDLDSYVQIGDFADANLELAVYDSNGVEVGSTSGYATTKTVSLTGFAPGMYFARVRDQGSVQIVQDYVLTISAPEDPNTDPLVVSKTIDSDSTLGSLRYALDYARNGETITFADALKGQTIVLDGAQLIASKSILIDATSLWDSASDAPGITISGANATRILSSFGNDLKLKGLRFTQGAAENGAAIYLASGKTTIENCLFDQNAATGQGGCLYGDSGTTAIVKKSVFNNNTSRRYAAGIRVTQSTLEVYDSVFANNVAATEGGAIKTDGATIVIERSAFDGNSANYGGAAQFYESTLALDGNSFSSNSGKYGGAVYINGGFADFRLNNFAWNSAVSFGGALLTTRAECRFEENEFSCNESQEGGAIYVASGTISFDSCSFASNSANFGGAVEAWSEDVLFVNCDFWSNSANTSGGGAYCGGTSRFVACFTVNNIAAYGGAIYVHPSKTASLTNCLVANNSASRGGASYSSGLLNYTNCTVADNCASSVCGGIYVSEGSVDLRNSVVALNDSCDVYLATANNATASAYNVLSSFSDWSNSSSDGVVNFIFDDDRPLFIDARNGDYRLTLGSQAIDKGNDFLVPSEIVVDLDGAERIQGSAVDLGAYESEPLEPDQYETNDAFEEAYDLGSISGVKRLEANFHNDDDVDYYKFSINYVGDENSYVRLITDDPTLNGWLQLTGPNGDSELLGFNYLGGIIPLTGLVPGEYCASANGLGNGFGYVLEISAPSVGNEVLEPDAYESNDNLNDARNLGTVSKISTVEANINVLSDEDWFALSINGTGKSSNYIELVHEELPLNLSSAYDGFSLSLELLDSNGAAIDCSSSGTGTERVSLRGLEEGTYYIRVYCDLFGDSERASLFAGASYSLTISAPFVLEPDPYEPNDLNQPYDLGTLSGISLYEANVSGYEEVGEECILDSDCYKFAIDYVAGADCHVSITFEDPEVCEVLVNIRAFNEQSGKWTYFPDARVVDGSIVAPMTGLLPGEYFVDITYLGEYDMPYVMVISAPTEDAVSLGPDDCESNDDFETAFDLGGVSGVAEIGASLSVMSEEDWYSFFIVDANGSDYRLELDFADLKAFYDDLGYDQYYVPENYYLDLELFDSDRALVGSATWDDANGTFPSISLDGLTAGVYYARVYNDWFSSSYERDGDFFVGGAYALTIVAPEASKLDSPVVSVSSTTKNSVVLNIQGGENASNYIVHYGTDPAFETYSAKSFASPGNATISALDFGTTYYFRVKATSDAFFPSDWATLEATTAKPSLAAPKLSVADASTASIVLSIGAVANAERYVLEYAKSPDFSGARSLDASPGTLSVSGLDSGDAYYFRVKATAPRYEDSAWKTISAATRRADGEPLDAPTFALSGTNTAIVIKLYPVEGAEKYVVDYSIDPSFASYKTKTYTSTETVKTISGLASETWYYVRVKAIASERTDSSFAKTSKIFTGASLDMPVVTVSAVKTAVVLNIKPVPGGEKYVVEYADNPDFVNAGTKTYSSSGVKTISGLTFGTRYYFRVKATSSVANDSKPNAINFAAGQLATPKFFVSEIGTNSLKIRCYNSASASGYEVMLSTSSDFADAWRVQGSASGVVTVDGLTPRTKYHFKVRALGDDVSRVNSGWSKIVGSAKTLSDSPLVVTTTVDSATTMGSLRFAIASARPGDVVTFDEDLRGKTITLKSELLVDKSVTIDASAIWDDENEKPGVAISGNNASRVFNIAAETSLIGLEITSGYAEDESVLGGAGVRATANVSLSQCLIANNLGWGCGAGVSAEASATLNNCVVRQNVSDWYGGGVYIGSSGTGAFSNCVFTENEAWKGGGVYIGSSGTGAFSNCVFTENEAWDGGGVSTEGSCVIENCQIVGNTAYGFGGGVLVYGLLELTNSSIADNDAAWGGGLDLYGSTIVSNCQIVGNLAFEDGGGVSVSSGSGRFVNCTIAGNSAINGGGLYVTEWAETSEFVNSIVANNEAESTGNDVFNNIGETSCALNARNVLSSYADWSNADEPGVVNYVYDPALPLFLDAENGDYRLAPGTQALNRGDNSFVTTEFDLAGEARIQDEIVDLGARERASFALRAPVVSASVTKSAVVLNIGAVAEATRYVVEYSTTPTFDLITTKTYASAGVKTISGLSSATTYYFRVKATSPERDDSPWSTLEATTKAASTSSALLDDASPFENYFEDDDLDAFWDVLAESLAK